MDKLYIKTARELTEKEIEEINLAIKREFHGSFTKSVKNESSERLLFLLKDTEEKILSMGQLIPVEPVRFKGENFSILGIGGIVPNIKGKGYGKKIMKAIERYLRGNSRVGIGLCKSKNRLFYKKCGFSIDPSLIKRFVYYKPRISPRLERGATLWRSPANGRGKPGLVAGRSPAFKNNKRIVNRADECVIYFDEEGSFMRKVIADRGEEILLSRPPDW